MTRTAAAVLVARGLLDVPQSSRFLDPRLAHLTPPDAMKDRHEAVARLARAARAKERICVFGDYDADGVTAAALVTDVLRALGAEVVPVLADRFGGGYGLSAPALARVLSTGASLLVTCDCGSSDHERLDSARRAGLDAVVIDHHRVPDEPLPALAFLNPHRPECGFAYKGLASVGLALSVGAGVRAELGVALDMRRWLDLVAIGTIGDVAPLDGDNRALVRAGLALLARGGRPGTRALAEIARCGVGAPTGEDVAFRLAPRINAPGRLDKPDLALALLLATSDGEARRIAAEVEVLCDAAEGGRARRHGRGARHARGPRPRRDCRRSCSAARDGTPASWGSWPAGWRRGSESRPSSSRSTARAGGGRCAAPQGFSVYDALARVRDVLLGFGGHHAAAGVEVASDRVETLRDRFCDACAEAGVPELAGLRADAILHEGEAPSRVVGDLERFEPCGQSNPAPRIGIERARLLGKRELRGGHLRVWLDVGGAPLSCFGGEMGHLASELGSHMHVLGALRRDTWQGGGAAEMRLIAAKPI